ncbi:hypothetical protein ACLB2K_012893 [Fragaria x ananassa]
MEELVYSRLSFSYERLKDDTTRSCFLYCAMYPEDHQIEARDLIEYWIWEGLLGDGGRIQANIWKGEMILADLKDSCLLDNVDADGGVDCVKMHDLIRDMAIGITNTSPRFVISSGVGVEKASLGKEGIEDVERISIMYNELKCLPGKPLCSKLSCLLLQYSCIANVVLLCCFLITLVNCDSSTAMMLIDRQELGFLQNFKSLYKGAMPSGALGALKILQISYCNSLESVLNPRLIEHLGNLEELSVEHCPKLEVVIEEEQSYHNAQVSLPRLKCLKFCD